MILGRFTELIKNDFDSSLGKNEVESNLWKHLYFFRKMTTYSGSVALAIILYAATAEVKFCTCFLTHCAKL